MSKSVYPAYIYTLPRIQRTSVMERFLTMYRTVLRLWPARTGQTERLCQAPSQATERYRGSAIWPPRGSLGHPRRHSPFCRGQWSWGNALTGRFSIVPSTNAAGVGRQSVTRDICCAGRAESEWIGTRGAANLS